MHLKVMFIMNHPKHERWGHKEKFHNVPLLGSCRKIPLSPCHWGK